MRRFLYSLFLLLVFATSVYSHPHIFIDSAVTIVFNKDTLSGVKTHWIFDEMYSAMLIKDYDSNQDGAFTQDEIDKLEEEAFSNISQFHYFTYVVLDGKKFDKINVKDFSATIENDCVVYTFFIICDIKPTDSYKKLKIAMYDETYYSDIALVEENPIKFENADNFKYTYKLIDDSENTYYYNQITPQVIIFNFKKK